MHRAVAEQEVGVQVGAGDVQVALGLLLPLGGCGGPYLERGLVRADGERERDQGADREVTRLKRPRSTPQQRVHETGGGGGAGQRGEDLHHAVHRDEVDNQQVDRKGAEIRPVFHAAGTRTLGPGGGVDSPAGTGHRMLVVLRNGHRHQRDLVLLVAVHDPQVGSFGQVRPATAGPLGVTVLVVVEFVLFAPAQRGSRRTGLLALRPPGRLRPALLARRRPARTVVLRGRHRGVVTVAREQMLQLRQFLQCLLQPLTDVCELGGHHGDLGILAGDHLGLVPRERDQSLTRHRLRIWHTMIQPHPTA